MIYTFVEGIFLASRFILFWFAFGYILPLLENFLPRCPKVYADLWSRSWSVVLWRSLSSFLHGLGPGLY
jgi:hypothetical protein